MKIDEVYSLIEQVGCMTFSTITDSGEVHSRIAHFNGYDDDGLYFRTMITKPYFRQLKKTKRVTVCGMTDSRVLGHEEDGTPIFPPSFSLRLIGEAKIVDDDIVKEKAKTNNHLKTAVQDMEKYPAMQGANFVMHAFKGEIFDTDFEGKRRDFKLYRERFSFGGVTFNEAGPIINEKCTGCGACFRVCTFKAISKTDDGKYIVNPNRCDDCGDCRFACKFDAIDESMEF